MNTIPIYSKKEFKPLENREFIQNVIVDSKFRDNIYERSSNFTIKFERPIHDAIIMKLVALEIPNTEYTFKNDIIAINMKHNNGNSKLLNISIPDGFYTEEQFINTINGLLITDELEMLKFSYNTTIGKIYIGFKTQNEYTSQNYNINDYTFSISFENSHKMCEKSHFHEILGFDNNLIENIENGIFSDKIVNFNEKYYYFVVDDFTNNKENTQIGRMIRNIDIKNILARPYIQSEYGKINYLDISDHFERVKYYNGPCSIQKLNVKILNKHGEVVDLNNSDISFIIEFQCLR